MRREPAWKTRFTTTTSGFPRWSNAHPDLVVYTSTESGTLQAWTADVLTGEKRQATFEPAGVEHVQAAGDGSGVVWWQDTTGNERGKWILSPATRNSESSRPLLPDLPDAWAEGIGIAPGAVAAAFSNEDGYRVYFSRNGEPARLLAESKSPLGIGREWENDWNGLSADGSLVCIRTSEHTDEITHAGLRVIQTADGAVVGEQFDGSSHLRVAAWSPVPGDARLAIVHELEDIQRPAIWNLGTGARTNLELDLGGDVDVFGWWPDGSALLGVHNFEGRSQLFKIDAKSEAAELLHDPKGWISGAGVRPDGQVWLREESSAMPPISRSLGGERLPTSPASVKQPPSGTQYESMHFENPARQRIHMFVAKPEGAGPFPTVMMVHGGPDWAYADAFDPQTQAFVDHGYLVAMVNYRGSTGYGAAFTSAIKGNVGFPEVEDVVAGVEALVAAGLADASRVVIEGWSWGGYVALLAPGLHPELFAAAIGGIPVADYVACHEDASPVQQAWDLAMNGGSPADLPEYYRERSPITYADRYRAPVLIIAGENDSRCPIRQVKNFVDAIHKHGGTAETLIYETGHHSNDSEEVASFAERELEFLHKVLPGVPAP